MINIEFKKRNIMISWSGGLDSTLILLKAVKQLNQGELDNIIIFYAKVKDNIDEIKMSNEIQAKIDIMKKLVVDRYLYQDDPRLKEMVLYNEVKVANFLPVYPNRGFAPQPLFWLSTSLVYIDDEYELVFGHLKDDNYTNYDGNKGTAQDMYEDLDEYLRLSNKFSGKDFIMNLPLREYTKADIINEYMSDEFYREYLPLVSYCESPQEDGTICGHCDCCIKTSKEFMKYYIKHPHEITNTKEFHNILVNPSTNQHIQIKESDKVIENEI